MSLQQAIEILKDELIKIKIDFEYGTNTTKQFLKGYKQALNVLEKVKSYQSIRQPSPDTQYKKDLTAWIERKNQDQNPYSIFETWPKLKQAHYDFLTSGRASVQYVLNPDGGMQALTLEQRELFKDSLMDSVKVCPRITEEGEG